MKAFVILGWLGLAVAWLLVENYTASVVSSACATILLYMPKEKSDSQSE